MLSMSVDEAVSTLVACKADTDLQLAMFAAWSAQAAAAAAADSLPHSPTSTSPHGARLFQGLDARHVSCSLVSRL